MSNFGNILLKVVSLFGAHILSDKKLIYILMDYHAFDDTPALKRLLKDLISDDFCKTLIPIRNNVQLLRLEINKYHNKLTSQYGYNEAVIGEAMSAIYAILTTPSKDIMREDLSSLANYSNETSKDREEPKPSITVLTSNMVDQDVVNYKVPEGVLEIEESAFEKRVKLQNVILPTTLKKIGECAFWGCERLENINLPQNLEIIDDYAFYHTNIHTLNLPPSVKKIGKLIIYGSDIRLLLHSPNIKIDEQAFWGSSLEIGIPRGEGKIYQPLLDRVRHTRAAYIDF